MDVDESTRLQNAMEEARLDLGVQWKDIAERAGISVPTLHRFRKEGPRTPDTTRKIERVFDWPRGYIEALVSGEPLPELESSPDPRRSDSEKLAELQRKIAESLADAEEFTRQWSEIIKRRERGA